MRGRQRVVATLLVGLYLCGCSRPGTAVGTCATTAPGRPTGARPVRVERVIDGDTFVIAGGTRVRVLGINTPESVDPRRPPQRYGRESAAYARRRLEGATVHLAPGRKAVDAYGRTLAWVWLKDGGFWNGELVQQGYARVNSWPDNADFTHHLLSCQQEARRLGRGLWQR